VAQLRARYPGVRIVEANYSRLEDGTRQQNIRYQAPLPLLEHYGLVTKDMLVRRPRMKSVTPLGCGFHLSDDLDCESRPGCWDLLIFTDGDAARVPIRQRFDGVKAAQADREAGLQAGQHDALSSAHRVDRAAPFGAVSASGGPLIDLIGAC